MRPVGFYSSGHGDYVASGLKSLGGGEFRVGEIEGGHATDIGFGAHETSMSAVRDRDLYERQSRHGGSVSSALALPWAASPRIIPHQKRTAEEQRPDDHHDRSISNEEPFS